MIEQGIERDRFGALQTFQPRRALPGVAREQYATEAALTEKKAAVVARDRVKTADGGCLADVAGAEQRNAADFEPRRQRLTDEICQRRSGQIRRQNLCLRQARCDQAKGFARDFTALAHGVNIGNGAAQLTIHHNAALTRQPCRLRQRDLRLHADGNDHLRGGPVTTAGQHYARLINRREPTVQFAANAALF